MNEFVADSLIYSDVAWKTDESVKDGGRISLATEDVAIKAITGQSASVRSPTCVQLKGKMTLGTQCFHQFLCCLVSHVSCSKSQASSALC